MLNFYWRFTLMLNLLGSLIFTVSVCSAVFGQSARIDAFDIRKSPLIEQIKALKAANPKITSAQLAEASDGLFGKTGVAFTLSFDAATCEKIRKVKERQKDPNAPIKLGATLKSVDADGAALSLPEAKFADRKSVV